MLLYFFMYLLLSDAGFLLFLSDSGKNRTPALFKERRGRKSGAIGHTASYSAAVCRRILRVKPELLTER